MSRDVDIRPALLVDIGIIAPRLRIEDREELLVSAGAVNPYEVMLDSFERSTFACTVLVDGAPAGMFGVCEQEPGIGNPWFLGTPELHGIPVEMVKAGRWFVQSMLARYPVLRNVIDARYVSAIRWAEMIGFQVGVPLPIGKGGAPFVPIEARA